MHYKNFKYNWRPKMAGMCKNGRKAKLPVTFSPLHNQLLQTVSAAKNRRNNASEYLRRPKTAGNVFFFELLGVSGGFKLPE
jgi:hypothetical protein